MSAGQVVGAKDSAQRQRLLDCRHTSPVALSLILRDSASISLRISELSRDRSMANTCQGRLIGLHALSGLKRLAYHGSVFELVYRVAILHLVATWRNLMYYRIGVVKRAFIWPHYPYDATVRLI
eukprot:scaffold352706_cov18-Prasinocladus_malaysianus.AAC.1